VDVDLHEHGAELIEDDFDSGDGNELDQAFFAFPGFHEVLDIELEQFRLVVKIVEVELLVLVVEAGDLIAEEDPEVAIDAFALEGLFDVLLEVGLGGLLAVHQELEGAAFVPVLRDFVPEDRAVIMLVDEEALADNGPDDLGEVEELLRVADDAGDLGDVPGDLLHEVVVDQELQLVQLAPVGLLPVLVQNLDQVLDEGLVLEDPMEVLQRLYLLYYLGEVHVVVVGGGGVVGGDVEEHADLVDALDGEAEVLDEEGQVHEVADVLPHRLDGLLVLAELDGLAGVVVADLEVVLQDQLELLLLFPLGPLQDPPDLHRVILLQVLNDQGVVLPLQNLL